MSTRALVWGSSEDRIWSIAAIALRPLQFGLAFPSVLYLVAMSTFLFRPPDIFSFYADRIAFALLVFFVVLRRLATREPLSFFSEITVPMLGLAGLAVLRAMRDPYQPQNWSIVASKYLVPFALFHISVIIFRSERNRRHFELFSICALAYLVFTAVAFLADARFLIFPKFILDPSLGFHADRARGPFLQAVANGVSINILGILLVAFQRRFALWILLIGIALPVAILSTMTRAVWISFAASSLAITYRFAKNKTRVTFVLLTLAAALSGLALGFCTHSLQSAVMDRTEERGPVQARMAVYEAGWAMFREHPFNGWAAHSMYSELGRRMSGYHFKVFYVHNTYLALLVEFGLPGLLLYSFLFVNIFRLGRRESAAKCDSLATLRSVWPVILGVYLFNAFFVDMAYQFVNGLLFTLAGILCARGEADA